MEKEDISSSQSNIGIIAIVVSGLENFLCGPILHIATNGEITPPKARTLLL
jgi:hypothetical protein